VKEIGTEGERGKRRKEEKRKMWREREKMEQKRATQIKISIDWKKI
jgi:hypothetical protein